MCFFFFIRNIQYFLRSTIKKTRYFQLDRMSKKLKTLIEIVLVLFLLISELLWLLKLKIACILLIALLVHRDPIRNSKESIFLLQ